MTIPKKIICQLGDLVEQIDEISENVAESKESQPQAGDWAPWISPFEGNYPRRMPRISMWVVEAESAIGEGDLDLFRGGKPEFVLTILLELFWRLGDRALALAEPRIRSSFLAPDLALGLLKESCFHAGSWSYQEGEANVLLLELQGECVAMVAEHKEGIYVAPAAWSPHLRSGREPRLVPMRVAGLLPRELAQSTAGLTLFIDMIRRAITEYHGKLVYCTNCCARALKEDLHGGECSPCSRLIS